MNTSKINFIPFAVTQKPTTFIWITNLSAHLGILYTKDVLVYKINESLYIRMFFKGF